MGFRQQKGIDQKTHRVFGSGRTAKGNSYHRRTFQENFEMSLLVLPGLAFFIIFHYLPMFGIVIAFKDFNPNLGIFGSSWAGLKNFEFYFTSQDAVRTIRNTVLYSLTFLGLDVITGVTLAIMFYYLQSRRALKFYNTVIILPRFMSMVVIAFIVYALLSPTYGAVNTIMKSFGAKGIQWYSKPEYWPFILILTHVWQTVGMNSIVYYAALMGMDGNLLEAALDGATKWQKAWYVLIPHLISVIVILTILGLGHLFSGDFGLFYQVTKDTGVLYPTTDIINTYTFRAMQTGALEKSAAVGLFQSLTGLILVLLTNGIVRKISPENSLF